MQFDEEVVIIANHCNVDFKPYEDDKLAISKAQQRSSYYGFTYVPFATLNGSGKSAYGITSSSVESALAKSPECEIRFNSYKRDEENIECAIEVIISPTAATIDNAVLVVAVVEDSVDYRELFGQSAKNGKNDYNHVLRDYLTPVTGLELGTLSKEEYHQFTYRRGSLEKYQNLRVVAFLQDKTSKEVIGVERSAKHPYQSGIANWHVIKKDSKELLFSDGALTFNLETAGALSCEVLQANGRSVFSRSEVLDAGAHSIPLPTNSLAPGCYVLRFSGALQKDLTIQIP